MTPQSPVGLGFMAQRSEPHIKHSQPYMHDIRPFQHGYNVPAFPLSQLSQMDNQIVDTTTCGSQSSEPQQGNPHKQGYQSTMDDPTLPGCYSSRMRLDEHLENLHTNIQPLNDNPPLRTLQTSTDPHKPRLCQAQAREEQTDDNPYLRDQGIPRHQQMNYPHDLGRYQEYTMGTGYQTREEQTGDNPYVRDPGNPRHQQMNYPHDLGRYRGHTMGRGHSTSRHSSGSTAFPRAKDLRANHHSPHGRRKQLGPGRYDYWPQQAKHGQREFRDLLVNHDRYEINYEVDVTNQTTNHTPFHFMLDPFQTCFGTFIGSRGPRKQRYTILSTLLLQCKSNHNAMYYDKNIFYLSLIHI